MSLARKCQLFIGVGERDALRREVRVRRDVDDVVGGERRLKALRDLGLQHLGRIQQRARAPHDVVRRRADRHVVVVEVAVELLRDR